MKLWWRRVDYPLRRPLRVAGRTLLERSVIELRLETPAAEPALGEASPLPGLHRETVDDLPACLPRALDTLRGHLFAEGFDFSQLRRHRSWRQLPPSLRCGLEAVAPRAGGDRPAFWKMRDLTRGAAPPTCVLVDRDLADLEPGLAVHRCVKIKVGRRARHLEIAMVHALRRVLGEAAELRLDANRAFGLDEALEFAAEVVSARPVWIEEPLRDPADLPRFLARSVLPVALDETLREPGSDNLAYRSGVIAWVLKPALLGFFETQARFDLARAAYQRPCCVVSSCFEGHVGLAQLQPLADQAPGLPAPGLGTADWLGPPDREEWREVRGDA